ncbi:MAG: 1-(5-phosphoribosyl)-5-[(5-phosphoribosylamino)methylideneamino]imidazole-4-carboxamide isomerase [Acidobacteriota bacterium]|nr:1-(5-phosphoribosyl)-5-[(5-phosphoribosylamino)methylideneamino]imidazole-4-carboxamide isomerase [Acidobacteriota bacterium]
MIEIIPAIDVIEGKAVRLAQGDFSQKTVYSENPLEVARQFEDAGIRRLHIVDLDGARNGRVTNLAILEQIAANTDLIVDFGGGIKTEEDAKAVFDAGAKLISVGSIAVKSPQVLENFIARFGGDKILLGADVRDKKISINGWQTATEIELISFLRQWFAKGIRQAFCTDIAKDGLLQGASAEIYAEISAELPDLKLIASGGVSRIEDFDALDKAGCSAAIVGKAIYEGKITLKDLSKYLKDVG